MNCFPSGAVNPFDGNVYVPDTSVTSAIVPVPPFASNVTVYVTTGISSHTACNAILLDTVILSPTFNSPYPGTYHFLNCSPAGAVNSFDGNVYVAFSSTSTSAIIPEPPFASNVTMYLVGFVSSSFQTAVIILSPVEPFSILVISQVPV